ncbi:ABC transporter ATP-binding protein, partial [Rhizobium ruizarguesonis]
PARLKVYGHCVKAGFDTGDVIDLGDYCFAQRPESGAEVVIGLRPEHFVVADQPVSNAAASFELPLRHAEAEIGGSIGACAFGMP